MPPTPASTFHLSLPSISPKPPKTTYIIYFLPGNPGLIEYYREFLTHLFSLLAHPPSSSPSTPSFAESNNVEIRIQGRSLSGFECTATNAVGDEEEIKNGAKGPYNVQQQVDHSERDIRRIVKGVKKEGRENVRVIVMGHSLGSYLCLELVRRFSGDGEAKVVGGVGLFATVVGLAKSPRGKKVENLLPIRILPTLLQALSKILFTLLPLSFLTSLVSTLLSFPQPAAYTTASFLKSPHGVHQAIYMAADEMHELSEDKWGEEVWGAATQAKNQGVRLKFLFAKSDHWIDNGIRDDLIRVRGWGGVDGEDEWKPRMEVDGTEGWTHDFCVRDSVAVAERVGRYVEDIVRWDLER